MATAKGPAKVGTGSTRASARESHRELLDEIEARMDELRRRFDLYFSGSPEQKVPPTTHQAQLGGELRRLREDEVTMWNTVDKFRFSQIFARFVSLDRMWARTMKQIEDGVYKRDKFKVAQMKKKAELEAKAQAPAGNTQVGKRPALDSFDNMDVDVGSFEDDNLISSMPSQKPISAEKNRVPQPVSGVGKAVSPPVVPPQERRQPAAAASANNNSTGGISDQRLKQLYDVYMQAKRRTGEASSLTIEGLRKQIEKQIPVIKEKHKCQHVDFKVVLKDGKAMLKAVPK